MVVSGGSLRETISYSQHLEAVHWLMSASTQMQANETQSRVRIFLVRNVAAVRQAASVPDGSNIAGFYKTSEEGAYAVGPRQADSVGLKPETVLFHEYAHHFMLQNSEVGYPAWYIEGFAEMFGASSFPSDGQIIFGDAPDFRGYELFTGSLTPTRRMLAQPSAIDREAGHASYGQYWLVTHYLTFDSARRSQLHNFITALQNGQTVEQANAAFVGGLDQLDADLRRYLRTNRFPSRRLTIPPNVMREPTVRTLSEGEVASIGTELQLRRAIAVGATEELQPLLASIGRLLDRYPNDPAILMMRTRASFYAGRYADTVAAADSALAVQPDNARALAFKGMAMLLQRTEANGAIDAASLRQCREPIIRANRLDPEDQLPLIFFYRSYREASQTPPLIALDGLYKAMRLVPREHNIRMTLAQEYIRRRQLPYARRVLIPLAYDPHPTSGQQYALQLVQWIDGGASGAPPVFVPVLVN